MSFKSPWQMTIFSRAITVSRFLLRPFGQQENRLVEKLTICQNRRVIQHLQHSPPENVLLIMPRCVKKSGCKAQVQNGLGECLQCRQCPLGDVAVLCERYEMNALVAFRSHIAFQMARTRNPDLIIATACHDRLVKALRTVPEYPALLAPLPPMEKKCINAGVDLVWLEQQLDLVCAAVPKARIAENS